MIWFGNESSSISHFPYFCNRYLFDRVSDDEQSHFNFLFLQVWFPIPIIMVVVASYLVFAPFYEAPLQSFYCVLFVSAGIPFYLGFVRYNVAPPSFRRFVGKSTRILHSNYMTIKLDSTHFFFKLKG